MRAAASSMASGKPPSRSLIARMVAGCRRPVAGRAGAGGRGVRRGRRRRRCRAAAPDSRAPRRSAAARGWSRWSSGTAPRGRVGRRCPRRPGAAARGCRGRAAGSDRGGAGGGPRRSPLRRIRRGRRARDGGLDERRVTDRGEVDEPRAMREPRRERRRDTEREAGLAAAAGTRERDHAALRERLPDGRDLGVATDERGDGARQVGGRLDRAERAGVVCGTDHLEAVESAPVPRSP